MEYKEKSSNMKLTPTRLNILSKIKANVINKQRVRNRFLRYRLLYRFDGSNYKMLSVSEHLNVSFCVYLFFRLKHNTGFCIPQSICRIEDYSILYCNSYQKKLPFICHFIKRLSIYYYKWLWQILCYFPKCIRFLTKN